MATRYELPINPDYVKSWTVIDAVREIFQNALDQQTTVEDNEMFWEIQPIKDDGSRTLIVANKRSKLDKSSMLLGSTTKANDDKTIGQFGEGYKLACLVLARQCCDVTIHNYGAKEVWTPKIIDSRRFNSKLLVIDVHKHRFTSVPDHDLTFVIEGLTNDEIIAIEDSNLHMFKPQEVIEDQFCQVLLDDRCKGRIYVNGLFVSTTKLRYGYNIRPQYIRLDRDRRMVPDFELHWLTSQVWMRLAAEHYDRFMELIRDKAEDVKFADSHKYGSTKAPVLDQMYESFKEEHGDTAVPVSSQHEVEAVKKEYPGLRPVVTSETHSALIRGSRTYERSMSTYKAAVTKPDTPFMIMLRFQGKYAHKLSGPGRAELNALVNASQKWRLEDD